MSLVSGVSAGLLTPPSCRSGCSQSGPAPNKWRSDAGLAHPLTCFVACASSFLSLSLSFLTYKVRTLKDGSVVKERGLLFQRTSGFDS